MQANNTSCAVCLAELSFMWTDTHGVGACWKCGLPYRIYHYEDQKRVDLPPAVAAMPEWVGIAKRYWIETKRRVLPAVYDMGILRGGRSYSGATQEDVYAWNEWVVAHKAELPAELFQDEALAQAEDK